MPATDFDRLADRLRNWGRWGPEDQRGTLNHIGPETLKAAAASVRSGKMFSLGLRFDKDGPQHNRPGGRTNPRLLVTDIATMLDPENSTHAFTDDMIFMPSQCATQWDALSHVHYDGFLYNGCRACDVLSEKGASRLGIEHLANPGIMSRGILLDIARLHGVPALAKDHAIGVDELNAACRSQGVSPRTGDIVLIHTGHIRRFTIDKDRQAFSGGSQPGLHHSCAEWAHDHDIAAVCADNSAIEVLLPTPGHPVPPLPMHMLCLRDMGMPFGEMFDLEALAADCAADGQYDFLFCAPPLAITGGVGSPVNPAVLK